MVAASVYTHMYVYTYASACEIVFCSTVRVDGYRRALHAHRHASGACTKTPLLSLRIHRLVTLSCTENLGDSGLNFIHSDGTCVYTCMLCLTTHTSVPLRTHNKEK